VVEVCWASQVWIGVEAELGWRGGTGGSLQVGKSDMLNCFYREFDCESELGHVHHKDQGSS
jgi:hypothetical protein